MDRYDPTVEAREALAQSVAAMRSARRVLADLSGQRPSCYYELGVAEAIDAAVVTVAETGTDIHQTAHRSDVCFFDTLREFAELVRATFVNLSG